MKAPTKYAAAAALTAIALCAGCSTSTTKTADKGAGPPTTGPSSSPTATPSSDTTPSDNPFPSVHPGSQSTTKVAAGYIKARDNAGSTTMKSVDSWVTVAKPYVTDDYAKTLAKQAGNADQNSVYQRSHDNHWTVTTSISKCHNDINAGKPTNKRVVLACDVTDYTVNSKGATVDDKTLGLGWPYTGKQPQAILKMIVQDDQWKIDADLTGQTS